MRKIRIVIAFLLNAVAIVIFVGLVVYSFRHDNLTHVQIFKLFWIEYLSALTLVGIALFINPKDL